MYILNYVLAMSVLTRIYLEVIIILYPFPCRMLLNVIIFHIIKNDIVYIISQSTNTSENN